ncbi:GumC family protein [uncultured Croceitalea sp.]|uniref:GumC family protein n=1 Tax=uncultured Croceitalea sp. TaxID=1798908 RepID=UPI00374E8226
MINKNNKTDFSNILRNYSKHWKWFFLSTILMLLLGFLVMRYTTPEYSAKAKIQILEDKGSSPELSVFQDLNIFSGAKNNVEDEIQIINSRSNFIEVIKKLELNIQIKAVGKISETELYGKSVPFKVNFLTPDSILHKSDFEFVIEYISNNTFNYSIIKEDNLNTSKYSFGENINTPAGDMVITPNSIQDEMNIDLQYKVNIDPIDKVAEKYQRKILVSPAQEFSNIVNLTLNDPVQIKARDILNSLIEIYNFNAVEDKKTIANKTSDFIDNRISDIYTNLSSVDQSAQEFKTGRGLTDVASQANINLNIGAASEQELQNASVQLEIAATMKNLIDNSENTYDILPSNVGLSDPTISATTARYNELVSERNRLLKSSNEKNPIIINLNQQLDGLKRNMQSSINSATNNLNLQVNNLSKQLSQINSRIYSAPKNERALRDITRKQQTTEQLYLYLLQKREEAQITYASASPKSKVIDRAYNGSRLPVSPNKKINYIAFFIIGVLIPFSIIYLSDLLDNKIHNKVQLEKIVGDKYPVLAELPKLSKKDNKLITSADRSVLGESLRILRTNLDYVLKSKSNLNKGKIVLVSSSIPGEGKTFLSSNLSMIFSSTKKRVLLLGADIRNPKLYAFFEDLKSHDITLNKRRTDINGLTEYLFNESLTYKNITNSISVNGNDIDVIYSGEIPPNPSELLMNARVKELFEKVREEYDYVIVDTAPLLVVTDTLLMSDYADYIIYVTKAGLTEEKVLEHPIKLLKEGKLKNLSFVVNNVKSSNLGYGGKYGYGYGKQEKKWWQIFKA